MSAISRSHGGRHIDWLFLGLLLSFSIISLAGTSLVGASLAGTQGTAAREQSLARLTMRHQYTGLMHGDQVISQSSVVEISEFDAVILDSRGYIVSFVGKYWSQLESPNARFSVELSPGRTYPAELVGVDERVYLGVFRSKGAESREIPFGSWSDRKKEIQLLSCLGDHWGGTVLEVLKWTERTTLPEKEVTGRLCDCISRQYARVGGLALDTRGRFLGLVSQAKQAGFNKRIDSFHIIPVGVLRDSVRQIIERGGSIRAGWLGISMNLDDDRVLVEEVVSRSPAEEGGIKVGDYIVRVNGAQLGSWMDLVRTIRWAGPEAKVDLDILRAGKPFNVTSVLKEHPDYRKPQFVWAVEIPEVWAPDEGTPQEKELKFYQVRAPSPASFGFLFEPLTPQLARYFKSPSEKGLLVKSVVEGSAASKLGFRAGDVIFEINEIELGTTSDIKVVLDSAKDGVLLIKYVREGEVLKKQVVLP